MSALIEIAGMSIATSYVYQPIPIRCFDWSAVDDRTYDGEGCRVGYGATEADAVAELILDSNDDWPDPAWTWRYHLRRLETMED